MTKHEAALRALEELERRATTGVWSAGKPDTNVSNWKLAATIRDALTAQGEAEKPSDYYDVDVPCSRCGGLGRRAYGSTATWRGGIGGAAITGDVCDKCWGSGEEHRPWRSWRELEAKLRRDADLAPSAPPASDPDDLPYDDGPEEPWCWGPGSPEHETNQCLHNGRDE